MDNYKILHIINFTMFCVCEHMNTVFIFKDGFRKKLERLIQLKPAVLRESSIEELSQKMSESPTISMWFRISRAQKSAIG